MNHDKSLDPRVIAYQVGQLRVEWRRGDLWAVTINSGCVAKDGKWEDEPLPLARSEAFLKRTRHSLQEAFMLAKKYNQRMDHDTEVAS